MTIDNIEKYDFSEAVEYHYGKFPPPKLDYERLARPLGAASLALGRYSSTLKNLHNSDVLLRPLRRKEAVISSRIEGTVATLEEVLKLEAEVENDGEEDDSTKNFRNEVIEVFSYERGLTAAQNLINKGIPLSGRIIRAAHSRLLFFGRGADKQPGDFKIEQNYVVDKNKKKVLFVPANPKDFPDLFKQFEEYMNLDDIDPLLQIAISHIEFEALHPFKDGNGRVGRMLITLMLWSKGLISSPAFYISEFLEKNKDEYIDRMRAVSAEGDWTGWCEFFLDSLTSQAAENLKVAEKIDALYEEMKHRFSDITGSPQAIKALDCVFAKPIFRNSFFCRESGIPPQTASRITNILAKNGILDILEEPSGRRSTLYGFMPLLEIVNE